MVVIGNCDWNRIQWLKLYRINPYKRIQGNHSSSKAAGCRVRAFWAARAGCDPPELNAMDTCNINEWLVQVVKTPPSPDGSGTPAHLHRKIAL